MTNTHTFDGKEYVLASDHIQALEKANNNVARLLEMYAALEEELRRADERLACPPKQEFLNPQDIFIGPGPR